MVVFKDKNQKNYGVKSFFVDSNDIVTDLEILYFTKKPDILSYHYRDNIVSLLVQTHRFVNNVGGNNNRQISGYSKKLYTISLIDMNISNKEVKKLDLVDDQVDLVDAYYRLDDQTLAIEIQEENLKIKKIKNSTLIDSISIQFKKNDSLLVKEMFTESFQFVRTNEYVKNGSISDAKFYYEKQKLYYTNYNKKDKKIITATISLQKDVDPIINEIQLSPRYSFKWTAMATYVYEDHLFLFCRNSKDMYLDVINFITGKSVHKANFMSAYSSVLDPKKINSLNSKLSYYLNKPTITVNKTRERNMLIRFDYVKSDKYYYNDNWWFHHQFMMQHQNVTFPPTTVPNRFGPNEPYINEDGIPDIIKKKDLSLEIILDPSYNILENVDSKTIYKKIETEKFIKQIKKINGAKFLTSSFTENFIRYLFYSKTFKTFVLKTSTYPK
ncbi:hypothetical protein GCM10009430_36430 [Aquimarina litoralis]|uniref:Uncharacterized protein n=2 Tax=Aquimarina litoralis TaxID=584605 RepID=A0ABN1J3R9_9FLAO